MKQRIGIIIALSGVVITALVVVISLSRTPAPRVEPPGPAPVTEPEPVLRGDLEIEGARITQQDEEGREVWSLEAETRVEVDAEQQVAEATGVRWLFRESGEREWIVEAPQVVLQYETGHLEFTDGVKLRTADGVQRFSVRRLRYEPGTRKLLGDGPVEYTHGGLRVTGGRLVVDTERRQIRLSEGTRARVRP